MKYVECKHIALVKCKYVDSSGKTAEISFYPFVLDKYTGQPKHTGFTSVTDEILDALKRDSNVFKHFVKRKLLTITENLPSSAQSTASIIAEKESEILKLKAEIENIKKNVDDLNKVIIEKDVQISGLKASLSIQQTLAADTDEGTKPDKVNINTSAKSVEYMEVDALTGEPIPASKSKAKGKASK